MKQLPAWVQAQLSGEPVVASGEMLMRAGLALPVLDPEQAILIHLTAAHDVD
jgi:alpha-galactosidase